MAIQLQRHDKMAIQLQRHDKVAIQLQRHEDKQESFCYSKQ